MPPARFSLAISRERASPPLPPNAARVFSRFSSLIVRGLTRVRLFSVMPSRSLAFASNIVRTRLRPLPTIVRTHSNPNTPPPTAGPKFGRRCLRCQYGAPELRGPNCLKPVPQASNAVPRRCVISSRCAAWQKPPPGCPGRSDEQYALYAPAELRFLCGCGTVALRVVLAGRASSHTATHAASNTS